MSKLRFLITGCGSAGKFVAEVAEADGRGTIAGLSDPLPAALDTFQSIFSTAEVDGDYYALLERIKPDVVVVASPDHLHADQAVAAIEAGCHVLIEKPLATSVADARRIIEAAAGRDICVMTDHTVRYVHPFRQMAAMARRGDIGTLFFVQGDYIHDMWSYYSPQGERYTPWRADPVHPQDILLGGGCHAIDLIQWTVDSPVVEVSCYSNKISVPEFPADDCYILIMRFENGVLGKVHVTCGCSGHGMGDFLEIYGTQGTLTKGSLVRRDKEPIPVAGDTTDSVVGGHGWGGSVKDFLDAIDGKIDNPIPAEEGAKTVAVCEAAIESAKILKPVLVTYT